MKSKCAVVTGARSGIGKWITEYLLNKGYNVIAISRSPSSIQKSVDCVTVEADIRNYEDINFALSNFLGDNYESVNLLINNAGVVYPSKIFDSLPANWSDTIQTNIIGAYNVFRALYPYLRRDFSQVIHIGSTASMSCPVGYSAYSVSKSALNTLNQAINLECNEYGIYSSVLKLGRVATSFGGEIPSDWHLQKDDVLKALEFLICSKPGRVPSELVLRPQRP